MIDYEKLKEAEKLANNLDCMCCFELYPTKKDMNLFKLNYEPNSEGLYLRSISFTEIDELLELLKELTPPKPKYKIGQEVWSYSFGQIKKSTLETIYWDENLNDYRVNLICKTQGKISAGQSIVYATKSELIEAQIEYWTTLLSEEVGSVPFEGEIQGFRDIKEAPCVGNIPVEKIQAAVDSMWTYKDYSNGLCAPSQVNKPKECQHESDGINYDNKTNEGHTYSFYEKVHLKCIKCGERYGYQECLHEADGNHYLTKPAQTKCKKCGEFYK